MSNSPATAVVTIKLNNSKSSRDEDDSLSICSGSSSSSDSRYNFKNRYSLVNNGDDEQTTLIRLNPRSYSSLSQYNEFNNLSVRVNMNRSSPIYEEKSEDCHSDNEVTATYKLNTIKNLKSKENGKTFLRKSDTVIEVVKDSNEDESEESVSFSFKPPNKKKSETIVNGCNESNGNYTNGDLNKISNDEKKQFEPNQFKMKKLGNSFLLAKYKDIDEMLGNLFKMIEDTNQTLNADELMEDFYEIEASDVKFHHNKALNAKLEEYREEIDSSAVRIRENKVFSTKLHEIREEIDKDSVHVRPKSTNSM